MDELREACMIVAVDCGLLFFFLVCCLFRVVLRCLFLDVFVSTAEVRRGPSSSPRLGMAARRLLVMIAVVGDDLHCAALWCCGRVRSCALGYPFV